jgi:hypothetical protein
MLKKIILLLLSSVCLSHANQEVVFGDNLISLSQKKLILYDENFISKYPDYIRLFQKYRKSFTDSNFEEFLGSYKSDDLAVKIYSNPSNRKNWIDRAKSVKDMQLQAFLVDKNSGIPEKMIYVSRYNNDTNKILACSVHYDKGILKLASSEYDKNSTTTKIKELWNKSYPIRPKLLDNFFDKLVFKASCLAPVWYVSIFLLILLLYLILVKKI